MVLKNTHIWLPDYIRRAVSGPPSRTEPVHVMFCVADHFEPRRGNPSYEDEKRRIISWCGMFTSLALRHRDSDRECVRHTVFYPEEEYREEHLEVLAGACECGIAEVEVHLHHENDTPENLERMLEDYKLTLASHGLLSTDARGDIRYGFVHGDWALDNSRKDGLCCGVNNELRVLKKTGCYADFTLPSAPSETQSAKINSIYYALDDPYRPKSHNRGVDVRAGGEPCGDLMIIQGPLALDLRNRKLGIFPHIENGHLSSTNLPGPGRVGLWVRQAISVADRENWVFVKVHTHGLQDGSLERKFFEGLDSMYSFLEEKYRDGRGFRLHYVSAREMYNIIKAAEAGERGDPGSYRDYLLKSNIRKPSWKKPLKEDGAVAAVQRELSRAGPVQVN